MSAMPGVSMTFRTYAPQNVANERGKECGCGLQHYYHICSRLAKRARIADAYLLGERDHLMDEFGIGDCRHCNVGCAHEQSCDSERPCYVGGAGHGDASLHQLHGLNISYEPCRPADRQREARQGRTLP